ncbi:MAG TPA: methyltransferase domain-containing protein [Phycisphaerales bacterium]|nr:methyltransferase domain-containing protein [Phycisphaerales bacterium]
MKKNHDKQPHSAEYFGEWRDYWWEPQYVALVVRDWGLETSRRVLDVGCGVGHWGRVLLPHLPGAELVGVDREGEWVKKAGEAAAAKGFAGRARYVRGDAGALPFADGEFDLVTCQTVLMHVAQPRAVVREMMRVLRPGGSLLAAEPNNMASTQIVGNTRIDEPIETRLALTEFQLRCERGKAALGEGNNSIGDVLPGMFAEMGLRDVRVRMSSRASYLVPPYDTPAQRALRGQMIEWARRGFNMYGLENTRRYYLAGGGTGAEFERLWKMMDEANREEARGLEAGTCHLAGGSVQYLICGRKDA